MSTLETAIVFTAVLTFLTFLITGTEELAINSLKLPETEALRHRYI